MPSCFDEAHPLCLISCVGGCRLSWKQADYVDVLEKAICYLDQAERYELMTGVFKLLLPFYEEQREFKVCMMYMYANEKILREILNAS